MKKSIDRLIFQKKKQKLNPYSGVGIIIIEHIKLYKQPHLLLFERGKKQKTKKKERERFQINYLK